jgi:hypothetical protein
MKGRSFAVIGAIVILIGIAALIHPRISYRVSEHEQQIGPAKVEFETRKVIHFPLWFSLAFLTIGAALVVGDLQKK